MLLTIGLIVNVGITDIFHAKIMSGVTAQLIDKFWIATLLKVTLTFWNQQRPSTGYLCFLVWLDIEIVFLWVLFVRQLLLFLAGTFHIPKEILNSKDIVVCWLRRAFKLILARWRSQTMKSRLRERSFKVSVWNSVWDANKPCHCHRVLHH